LVMKNFDFKEQSESVSPGGAAVSVNNNFIGSYSSLKTFLKRLRRVAPPGSSSIIIK